MKTFNTKSKTALALGVITLSMVMGTNAHAEETAKTSDTDLSRKEARMRFDIKKDMFGDRDDKKVLIKKMNASELDVEKIRLAIESKNFTEFKALLLAGGVKEEITEAQFTALNEAYVKARAGDISGAQKLMKDNNLLPMLNRFVMGQHLSLTDAQKEILKQAEDLIKQGKNDEAKALLESADLPIPMAQKAERREDVKIALDKAKDLREDGQNDEAAQVLKDAGISQRAILKIEKEFDKDQKPERKSLVNMFKKFFKFGNR